MKKRYFGILFAVCMTVLLLTVTAYAAESGTCGASDSDDLTWTLTDDGTLTISGTGNMANDAFYDNQNVKSVVIEGGVTGIGGHAFSNCMSLTSITLPASVTSIGVSAFYRCTSLESVYFLGNVTTLGESSFDTCNFLSKVYCYTTNTAVRSYSFPEDVQIILMDGTSDNLTWRLTPDGILTITGTGEIPDPAPWQPLEEAGLIKYTLGGNSTTMVLTEDLTITETLQITGDTTIDLNGHTLTYAGKVPGSVIHVNTGATLTLNDSSTTKTGTITGGTGLELVSDDDEVGRSAVYYGGGIYNYGTFTMNGGTIKDCELPFDVDSHVFSYGGGVCYYERWLH